MQNGSSACRLQLSELYGLLLIYRRNYLNWQGFSSVYFCSTRPVTPIGADGIGEHGANRRIVPFGARKFLPRSAALSHPAKHLFLWRGLGSCDCVFESGYEDAESMRQGSTWAFVRGGGGWRRTLRERECRSEHRGSEGGDGEESEKLAAVRMHRGAPKHHTLVNRVHPPVGVCRGHGAPSD